MVYFLKTNIQIKYVENHNNYSKDVYNPIFWQDVDIMIKNNMVYSKFELENVPREIHVDMEEVGKMKI